ncbi:MAG: serine hydrolase domain-containing protein [Actinomycetota bacterium]
MAPTIHGEADPRFEPVRAALATNFDEDEELGASAAVIHRGRLVCDVWGGAASVDGSRPWRDDTIVNLWSTTKTVAALVVLTLHEQGVLSVDDPIARYWPEFAAEGKDEVRIRHALSHLAGLHEFRPVIDHETMFDWDTCCARLAAQPLIDPPGQRFAYHAFTQGFLLGEVVRRLTGQTMGDWLRGELTEPHGIDFHLGTPAAVWPRVAESDHAAMPASNDGPDRVADVNTDRWRLAEFPSSNGHGNARSVAQLLSLLTRTPAIDRAPVGEEVLALVREVQWDGPDPVTGSDIRMGVGFGHSSPSMPLGVNDDTVWWAGLGGSMAVVDLEQDLVVTYAMNRLFPSTEHVMRSIRVVHAAHASVRA